MIPKLLINASWWIAILSGSFLERPTMWPNLDPRTLYLSPKYFKTYKNILTQYYLSYRRIWNTEHGRSVYIFFICYSESFETLKCGSFGFQLCFWNSEIWKFEFWTCYILCNLETFKVVKLSSKFAICKLCLGIMEFANPQHPSTYRLRPLHLELSTLIYMDVHG